MDPWKDLVTLIHRDRNHPSVVIWSAGNEIGEQSLGGGHEILRPLIETFHREDPTRPVTTGNDHIAADGRSALLPFLEMLDIVGYNYVDRWHERRELYYSLDKLAHPDWMMVGTESVSNGGIRGGYRLGRDSAFVRAGYHSRMIRAEQLWKFEALHDYVIGDFMWTGIDYLGETRWPSKNASSGVIDLCGFPKDGYYFYQSQWTDEPVLHVFPHWNWEGREGQVLPVVAYTNCDTVELFLNGRSFGNKSYEFPRQGNAGRWNRYARPPIRATTADLHLSWDVPYEPGTLMAVGKKNGRMAVVKEIKTTGEPASIRLSADRETIHSDARDVVHITVEVLDKEGLVVPTAANRIRFIVRGKGKLIGVDNGNPMDRDSFQLNERNAFNGLALAIVRSTGDPGKITITAESDGLKGDKLEITTAD
jgi:beta-galactosidase